MLPLSGCYDLLQTCCMSQWSWELAHTPGTHDLMALKPHVLVTVWIRLKLPQHSGRLCTPRTHALRRHEGLRSGPDSSLLLVRGVACPFPFLCHGADDFSEGELLSRPPSLPPWGAMATGALCPPEPPWQDKRWASVLSEVLLV